MKEEFLMKKTKQQCRRILSVLLSLLMLLSVFGGLAFTASASDDEFTVTFVVDGETVATKTVAQGESATAPEMDLYQYTDGDETHKKFSGWDTVFTNVQSDLTVSATYDEEAHTWVDGEITLVPTCMETGTQAISCACGAQSEKVLRKDSANHTRQNTVTTHENVVAATCTSEGGYDEIVTCECGGPLRFTHITEPMLPHTESEPVRESFTPATCTEAARYVEVVNCSVCGNEVSRAEKTEGEPLGHDWSEWTVTKAATCTEKGSKTRTCSRCGETEEAVLGVIPHLDENSDTVCDLCGAPLENHKHTDENYDNICDTCGRTIDTGYRCSLCNDNARIQAGSDPEFFKVIYQIVHFFVHGIQSIKYYPVKDLFRFK